MKNILYKKIYLNKVNPVFSEYHNYLINYNSLYTIINSYIHIRTD